ncbi:ATP-binding cassette domain-containing protein [Nonomuraea thailandensis]
MNLHVEARNVVKRFGPTTALNGAELAIAEGETHALVGRNGAGKSTLVSILTGLQRPDEGEVRFSGQAAPALADRDAWRQRVACVYQKSTIIPALTVAENLFLNRQSAKGARINWRGLRARARELLDTYEVDVDAQALAGDLSVEQRQLVEIARALSFGARFIILDEPTARLDGPAIERLFTRMRSLREQGVTMMYISHHLDEVYEICQSVTVFRDARHVTTRPVADLPHDELVAAMTGRPRRRTRRASTRPASGWCCGARASAWRGATRTSTSPSGRARSSAWPAPRAAARSASPRPWSGCAGPTPARSR